MQKLIRDCVVGDVYKHSRLGSEYEVIDRFSEGIELQSPVNGHRVWLSYRDFPFVNKAWEILKEYECKFKEGDVVVNKFNKYFVIKPGKKMIVQPFNSERFSSIPEDYVSLLFRG